MPSDPLFDRGFIHKLRGQEGTVTHEIVHNYFYGLVGNDEQREAFLDEGFTEFWGFEVYEDLQGDDARWAEVLYLPFDIVEARRRAAGKTSSNVIEPPSRLSPVSLNSNW